MKFDKYFPSPQLRPYIKYFVVSESELENEYKVFPTTGLVIGFQYRGQLAAIKNGVNSKLTSAGITGISDGYKIFKNSPNTGSILIYFTETGFAHFTSQPVNELFNLSLALDDVFEKNKIEALESKLAYIQTDCRRIEIVEAFLLSQFKDVQSDKLIAEAVNLIYLSRGTIRIKELNKKLLISQSPFEKRFRKVVGTTAKKFASIVRFNAVLDHIDGVKTLTEICYESNFFDQAHFVHDFKQFTGESPEKFKRFLNKNDFLQF